MQTQKKAYSKTVRKTVDKLLSHDPYQEKPETESDRIVRSEKLKKTHEFKTLAEQVARSSIFVRNWYCKEARLEYPTRDWMKRIDKFFPYAEGGPLLVDEPLNEHDAEPLYREKAKVYKAWGYRYAVIERFNANPDLNSNLFGVLQQLGET